MLAVLMGSAASASADGDPASDVLAVQKLFLPADARIPVSQQLQLSALLSDSARKGYPLRVAIVGTESDLGSVTALWRQPETYARFLGKELALVFHGTVLVVMPNGYGAALTTPRTRHASGEAQLPVPGRQLGSAAIAAVERLAASAGKPVAARQVHPHTVAQTTDALPWLVFGLGFVPLALAWGMSLKRQPLTVRTRQH
jgi:hypothetical protein